MLPSDLRRRHPLVVQGFRVSKETDGLHALASSMGLDHGEYRILDKVLPRSDLSRLYATSRVVVMPSLGEGLGLPVLEAWASGTPAVASSTTSLGELIASPEWVFDPLDTGEQASLLHLLLTDDGAWHLARAHGEARSVSFTWAKTAERAVQAIAAARADGAGTRLALGDSRNHQRSGTLTLALVVDGQQPRVACREGSVPLAALLEGNYLVSVLQAEDPLAKGRGGLCRSPEIGASSSSRTTTAASPLCERSAVYRRS